MADLITSARAKYNINQASFSSAEDTTIAALVTAVSKAVKRYCRREFDSQSFDELYPGSGDGVLVLRQYPILSVSRVATNPVAVLRVKNASASNQRATVAVTSTGLTLVRVASGTTTTDTSVTWAGAATVSAVAAAVNALGNGWSADYLSSHASRASADFKAPEGALNALNAYAPLKVHVDEVADYDIDAERGWLTRPNDTFGCLFNDQLGLWPQASEYRVIYTAGYATVPEDVQEACAQWVASLFWQTKDNPAVYPDAPTGSVAFLLDHYRKHRV